jgi:hypothetical protein
VQVLMLPQKGNANAGSSDLNVNRALRRKGVLHFRWIERVGSTNTAG